MPDNLRLLRLPPYSPELNPMEQVFQYLKANRFANQVFKNVAAVQEACQAGWDWFRAMPEKIASILHRDWAMPAEAAKC